MRKIDELFENPIDHVCISIAEIFVPTLHALGITPNQVTTFGNILRIASIYYLKRGNNFGFLVTSILSYISDCVDGHLARSTNQTSSFGDWYDHISDVVYHVILIYLIFSSNTLNRFSFYAKMGLIFLLVAEMFLCLKHIGCQESMYQDTQNTESPTLSFFQSLCENPKIINWTKYFGCGTLAFMIYIFIYLYFQSSEH
jgi:phosphatidylglycerophosphate synthase